MSGQRKRGGSFVKDVQNLAVPFSLLLAKAGVEAYSVKKASTTSGGKTNTRNNNTVRAQNNTVRSQNNTVRSQNNTRNTKSNGANNKNN